MTERERVDLEALSDLGTPWCVHVVATLRIAEHLAAGTTGIQELAAAAGRPRHPRPGGPGRRAGSAPWPSCGSSPAGRG